MVYQSQSDVEHGRVIREPLGADGSKNSYVFLTGGRGEIPRFPSMGIKAEQRAINWNGGGTQPCLLDSGRQCIRKPFRYYIVDSLYQIQSVKHNVPCSFGISSDREIG